MDTRVHVVCNPKGGVGKTRVTMNLAATTAYVRDPERERATTVAVACVDRQSTGQFWASQAANQAGKPLRFDFYQLDTDVAAIRDLAASGQYEDIFIDTAGFRGRNAEVEEAAEYATDAIVPMNPDGSSLDPTEQIVTGLLIPRQIPYWIVVNDWDPRDGKKHLDDTFAWIDAHGWRRVASPIRRFRAIASAPEDGLTAPDYASKTVRASALHDFMQLGMSIGVGTVAMPQQGGPAAVPAAEAGV